MGESNSPEIKSLSSNEKERFESCVILGLESMASEIAGQNIKMENRETALRKSQEERFKFLDEKKLNKKLAKHPELSGPIGLKLKNIMGWEHIIKTEKLKTRLDLFNVRDLVRQLKNSDSKIGEVFKTTEIRHEKGDLTSAENYLKQGYQVGIAINIPVPQTLTHCHFFHLAKDGNGELIDKSDCGKLKLQVENWITTNQMDLLMERYQKISHSWGLLLMKKKHSNDLD